MFVEKKNTLHRYSCEPCPLPWCPLPFSCLFVLMGTMTLEGIEVFLLTQPH